MTKKLIIPVMMILSLGICACASRSEKDLADLQSPNPVVKREAIERIGKGKGVIKSIIQNLLGKGQTEKAVPILVEMLDPSESAGTDLETQDTARAFKRALILTNGLRAASQLASANPSADLSRLAEAVGRLAGSEVDASIRASAAEVLHGLQGRPTEKRPDR